MYNLDMVSYILQIKLFSVKISDTQYSLYKTIMHFGLHSNWCIMLYRIGKWYIAVTRKTNLSFNVAFIHNTCKRDQYIGNLYYIKAKAEKRSQYITMDDNICYTMLPKLVSNNNVEVRFIVHSVCQCLRQTITLFIKSITMLTHVADTSQTINIWSPPHDMGGVNWAHEIRSLPM